MNKIDLHINNLNRVITWIKQADQKAFALLTFQGVFLGFYVTKFDLIINTFGQDPTFFKGIVFTLLIIFLIISITSFTHIFKTIFPDINNIDPSLLFFADISNMGLTKFKKGMKELKDEDYIEEIEKQTFTNSVICTKKYTSFKAATKLFILSFFLGLIVVFLLQLSQIKSL